MRLIDLTGQRFCRLTVLSRAPNDGRRTVWNCRCDCGTEKPVRAEGLRCGDTLSCGCWLADKNRERATHGMSKTPLHRTWCGMFTRCRNPRERGFANYGGRGIEVCERWHSFEKFAADMGERPPGTTIDRIDNNKGYSPDNCRWANRMTQGANRRMCFRIRHQGEIISAAELARRAGYSPATMHSRARKLGRPKSEIIEAEDLLAA